jgi:hypothetical protein
VRDENLADAALVAGALHGGCSGEVGGRRFSGLLEDRSEKMGVALHRRGDDHAGVEVHASLVVALGRMHTQSPRLPAEIEKLKDVVDAELAERSLDCH